MPAYSSSEPISRREFIKWGSTGLSGLFLFPFRWDSDSEAVQLGRVLDASVHVRDAPSFSAKLVKIVWRDLVIPIYEATVGDEKPAHNRVWYRTVENGYVHSGSIQPVEIRVNEADADIPAGGRLAEVTVPFCEARWQADPKARAAYRLYYGTTHWVTGLVIDKENNRWYQIVDDKWKFNYFISAPHLRLIPPSELAPISPDIPLEGKRLEIRLKEQAVIAYEWNRPVYTAKTATGAVFSNGNFTTPTGRFISYHKRPSRHMAAGDYAAPNSYDLPGVPWVCYFTPEGISLHGTFWHHDFGRPRSHGCINLSIQDARWFYLWTAPEVPPTETYTYEKFGTTIDII